ncbi:MAG: hypothetical protein HYY37_04850 [Candidatus Aenigmarchaeota archaeon]|nr:hypothetical protein [Candidatus Aenigmarchaeota archaeon]
MHDRMPNFDSGGSIVKELRTHRPGYFQPFPYDNFLAAVQALAAAALEPDFYHEVGLAGYARPRAIYVVHGSSDSVPLAGIEAAKGWPEVTLHTHLPGSALPFFPTVDDFIVHSRFRTYEQGMQAYAALVSRDVRFRKGADVILSRAGRRHYLTKYGFDEGFSHPDSGTCIWPDNEQGTGVRSRFYRAGVPCEIVTEAPLPEIDVMRVLKPSGRAAIDVVSLYIAEAIHARHGDALFFDRELDWYEEGKKEFMLDV